MQGPGAGHGAKHIVEARGKMLKEASGGNLVKWDSREISFEKAKELLQNQVNAHKTLQKELTLVEKRQAIREHTRELAERHMQGHWKHMARVPEAKPYLWRWEDIHAGLMKATEVVPMSDTPRRTIQLKNPSLGDRMTNTIHISVQCVMPGEIATAHRHNAAAIRFVVPLSRR